jgi:hypothetical protein
LYEKVLIAQKSGALGVLIADDGSCGEEFLSCGARVGSISEGGFAPYDSITTWQSDIRIPVLLISSATATRLRKVMEIKKYYIPKIGWQNVSSISLLDEEL